jgi:hypothetical protein
MDVLAYSAFNQQVALNQQITAKTSCLSTKCSETAALQATAAGFSAASLCWIQCTEPCLLRVPQQGYASGYWSQIPSLTGASQGFKVCDTASQFNCGFCCQWTVPAGITRARFQLWGAGGSSGPAPCCCGDAPFGSTGAYASVIIPVTAGNTYTICSGCAYCCFGSSTSGGQRLPGCPSWVTGTGLNNFCANGGPGGLGVWMSQSGNSSPCYLGSFNCTGHSICNQGGNTCVPSACSSGLYLLCYTPGASYFGTTTSVTSPSIVYGIRGMWPAMCWESNNYGYQCHPPIYGFESSSQCNPSYSSGTCCGYNCRAAAGYLNVPGAGGFYSHAMGGNTSLCGDMGRMGMVCVTYC